MFGIKSTENRSWVICHPFPANLLVNFIVFETHFQAKTTHVLDPTCSLLVPSFENVCVPSSCWHCLHKPVVLGIPGSSSWIWTQPAALTVPELLLSYCPCNSSHWVLNVAMKMKWKGLSHLFGFMYKCHPSLQKSLFPHPKITILNTDWIVNKYPKNTQKRIWVFSPSITSKQVSHNNKQEKSLINISFLLTIHISMPLFFWQLHLKVLEIAKRKPKIQKITTPLYLTSS